MTHADWDNVRQQAEIEDLKRQIADLHDQDNFIGNEITVLAKGQDSTSNVVSANANVANANSRRDDARWDAIRSRLGI